MRQFLIAGILGIAACVLIPSSKASAQYGYVYGRHCGPNYRAGYGVPGVRVGYGVGYGYSYAAPFPYYRSYQATRVVVPNYRSNLYRASRAGYGWGGYGNLGYPSTINRPGVQLRIGF